MLPESKSTDNPDGIKRFAGSHTLRRSRRYRAEHEAKTALISVTLRPRYNHKLLYNFCRTKGWQIARYRIGIGAGSNPAGYRAHYAIVIQFVNNAVCADIVPLMRLCLRYAARLAFVFIGPLVRIESYVDRDVYMYA
ncbi:unnamed protein product, partial [Iphiclides podalirius]